MARFLSRQFQHGGDIYHLELSIDRIAALRDDLTVNILVRRYSPDGDGGVTIEAALTLDLGRNEIVIEIEGEELGRIPLDATAVADADEADAGAEGVARDAWDALTDHLFNDEGNRTEKAIESIIESIPAGDPFLGCLLKGAISASVGQIIRCHRLIDPREETVARKLRSIANCLGRNVRGILGRATVRSLRCMVSLGFG